MSTPFFAVEGLVAGYGPLEVLKEISLRVDEGEVVTLIGANGAGKTTTLMAISGINSVRRGSITFRGERIDALPPHEIVARGIVQVPEGRKIFPRMSIRENLQLGAFLRSDAADIATDIEKVCHLFPILKDRINQAAGTLSGGEQQMLALGRALMTKPKFLLLDEPSMGVAPLIVAKIFETLSLLKQEGMTILLVEQNAHLALEVASRGYVLETGSVLFEDLAANLRSNPKIQEAYLGQGG